VPQPAPGPTSLASPSPPQDGRPSIFALAAADQLDIDDLFLLLGRPKFRNSCAVPVSRRLWGSRTKSAMNGIARRH
jgi:hypothetical protein